MPSEDAMTKQEQTKGERFKAKMKAQNMKEMRGVYVPIKHEKALKDDLRAKVKKILEGN